MKALVCTHFRRSDTILLPDNKSDLISIVWQLLLECERVTEMEKKVRYKLKVNGKGAQWDTRGIVALNQNCKAACTNSI